MGKQLELSRLQQRARNLRDRIRKCRRPRETRALREMQLELAHVERLIDAMEVAA